MEMLNKFAKIQKAEEITEDELNKILKFTLLNNIEKDKIFIFKVALCNNEVDRDFECFTTESLNTLAEMFVGKTGITDHSMKSENQIARLYATEVVVDNTKLTSYGEPFAELVGKAYMVRTEKNSDLISEIEMGIKKEVSVSCSVSAASCSICGCDLRNNRCEHKLGEAYNNDKCFAKLENPTDAYEWSFVAVPAQVEAGVKKAAGKDKYKEPAVLNKRKIINTLIRAFSCQED